MESGDPGGAAALRPERDIARIMGLRPGSVRSATHRALKALGQSLEEAP